MSRFLEIEDKSKLLDIEWLIDYLFSEVQFSELGIKKDELRECFTISGIQLSKRSIIEIVTNLYFKEENLSTKYVVIKHPPYNYITELIQMFPSVKFIQIIRDGRGVFNSKKRSVGISSYPMEKNTIMAAWDWRWKVMKSRKYPDHVYNVKYEDLLLNAEETLNELIGNLSLTKSEMIISRDRFDYFNSTGKF